MSVPFCQFVDRVGRGAVQRLNLNDGDKLRLLTGPDFPGPDFSPPRLKRAVVNTLLAEGASIPASAYDNRVIRLPLRVKACDQEEMATIQESLHRELDRANNILKWQPTYNSKPVYFRTFRSPDYRLDQTMEGRGELRATLALVAEPFAYGDYIEQTGTIYNDPAAVANGIHFEIAAVEGDVPTPLYFYASNRFAGEIVLGARRHGTPALYFMQAEAMVQGLDTAVQANDPLMSGAGMNWSQTTFAVWPGLELRLSWLPCPGAGSSVEYRGLYRLFFRVRRTSAVGDINITPIYNGVIPRPWIEVPKTTNIQLLDLGLVSIPPTPDPVYDGYAGTILPVDSIGIYFYAERLSGGSSLDWDYAVLVPADEEFIIATVDAPPAGGSVLDGPNDIAFHSDGSMVMTYGDIYFVGSIPLVSPDQTNLYVALRNIDPNAIADTMTYTARYWPRYLYIR